MFRRQQILVLEPSSMVATPYLNLDKDIYQVVDTLTKQFTTVEYLI